MKALLISLLAGGAGIASTLAGLAWDAWLHSADPTLAQREGIFTLTNPGHALLGLGVLLTCGGILAALHTAWGMAKPRGFLGKPYVRTLSMRLSALVSIGAVLFALTISSSGHEHAHADEEHAHTHTEAAGQASLADAPLADEDHAHTEGEHTAASTDDDAAAIGEALDGPAGHTREPAAGDAEAASAPHTHASASSPAADTAAGHQHAAVDVTAEEIACGNELVRDTQEATARFADINVALAEGYRNNPDKPGATHYGNPAYKRDGKTMDLAHPESLIYYTNPRTGESVLLGALFTMARGEDGPQPCGAATSWHTHAACGKRETGELIPVEPGTACAEGYRYGESVQMMHVWFVPGRKNGVAPAS